MISKSEWDRAVDFALRGTQFADSVFHGEDHWRAVASQGISLAHACKLGPHGLAAGALFGLFHDCRRENDGYDPEHGLRAAKALANWAEESSISATLHDELLHSLILHDNGQVTKDLTVGLGWDADRSTLGRVGIAPDYKFFSCVSQTDFDTFIAAGETATAAPPSWDEIYTRAFVRN